MSGTLVRGLARAGHGMQVACMSENTRFQRVLRLSLARARQGAVQQKLALAFIARERGGALKLCAGLVEAAELPEKITSHARQQVIGLEGRLRGQLVDQFQPR